jgi:DNA invertase Pin-like site-specific DNA recombinase
MGRAYSYIRFSRDHQSRGDSLRRQIENTRAYCARHGLILDESLDLRDLGVSSFRGRNVTSGALGRFLEACQRGIVKPGSALIVEALDRLSRQSPRKTVSLLMDLLETYRIEVHLTSTSKVFKPNAGDQEGLDLIIAVAMAIEAHQGSEEKSRRLVAAWANLRKRAAEEKRVMRAALPWWLTLSDGVIVSPPERASVVKEVFQLTASGFSSAQVARKLNELGRKTWRPQLQWTSARVRGLIQSQRPEGVLEATQKTKDAGRDYEIPGYYPKVVDSDLAAAARSVMARNIRGSRGRQPHGTRPINLFRSLIRFKGKWLRHATHRNGTRDPISGKKRFNSYYECFDELGDTSQGKLLFCISGNQLEPLLITGLAELRPEDIAPPILASPDEARLTVLRGQVEELKKKEQNLLAAIESGSAAVATRLVEVEAERKRKESEVSKAETLAAQTAVEPIDLKSLAGDLSKNEVRERMSAAIRRMVQRIDIGESFSDLGITDDFRRAYVYNRAEMLKSAKSFPDPVPQDKRRRMLHVLVKFVSGAYRVMSRETDSHRVITFRLEPWAVQA